MLAELMVRTLFRLNSGKLKLINYVLTIRRLTEWGEWRKSACMNGLNAYACIIIGGIIIC